MSKLNRIVMGTICAAALLSTVGCGRRLPAPCENPELAANRYRRMGAAAAIPGMMAAAEANCPDPANPGAPTDPGPGAPAPTDPGPGTPPPGPAPIDPGPGAPGPAPIDPGPGAPPPGPAPIDPGPGPDPVPPAPVDPPPAPVDPAPEPPPTKPDPAPEPEPEPPTPEDIFLEKTSKIGFFSPKQLVAALQENIRMRPKGWTKGKHDTPEANVQAMWEATRILFSKIPETAEEYHARSMNFVENTHPADLIYYVDLKTSQERQDLYVMRFNPNTTEIVGVKVGDTAYAPIGAQSAYRAKSGGEPQVFFYGEERGRYISSDRFIQVPAKLLYPDWEQRMEAQRVQRQSVRYNSYRAPVSYSTYRGR